MYKSPIEIIQGELQTEMDGAIMKAVQKVDIIVDKDELLHALAYDRGQYQLGFRDGKAEVHGVWLEDSDGNLICSKCKFKFYPIMFKFCPNCGADMRLKGGAE